ncbi:hypothetical protein M9H77_21987 [Catharanthus roseus]|uniref:Uncharacterized protein n=1 Tax=Catharanthus roseus TaxID=4058 RepID=A0ACC0AP88_CATRO|nr:hypothetical protein M9H77_21987 [Catharanthus roseus]
MNTVHQASSNSIGDVPSINTLSGEHPLYILHTRQHPSLLEGDSTGHSLSGHTEDLELEVPNSEFRHINLIRIGTLVAENPTLTLPKETVHDARKVRRAFMPNFDQQMYLILNSGA